MFIEKEAAIPLPDINTEAYYVVQMLDEIGAVTHSGTGLEPLTWQEINNWLAVSDTQLSYWELCTLKDLSYEYAAELSVATESDRKAPYVIEGVSLAVPNLEAKLLNAFASFNRRNDESDEG